MRYLIRSLVLLLATQLSPAQTWETINANYTNLRGINFVPVYTNRTVGMLESGAPGETASTYHGVASATAMWRFYDSTEVARQLGWVKRTGFNMVRVFMSHPAWSHNPSLYVQRWSDFVDLCEARGLHVMPVLWDGVRLADDEPEVDSSGNYIDPFGTDTGTARRCLDLAALRR